MKRIVILLSGCIFAVACFGQIPKPVKTNPANKPVTASQKNVTLASPKNISRPVIKQTSYPASWLKSGMNVSWVIPAGNWLQDGFNGFLLSDKKSFPFQYSRANIPMQSLVLYPLQVEDAMDIEYLTPVDLGYVHYNPGVGEPPVSIVQIFNASNYKTTAWRVDKWPDGTISLLSLRYHSYLALEKLPDNKVYARLIDSANLADPMKVKFLLYGLYRTVKRSISFYHPGTKTFLGLEANADYFAWYNDAFGAKMSGTKKTAVRFIGTQNPDFSFDFGDVSGSQLSLRGFAPGEGFDMDGDGHNAVDVNGDDCDDKDPHRFPGNPEKMDSTGHDENCICDFELVDKDHDGHYDVKSFNVCGDGTIVRGDDCDDSNPAIFPGAIIFISETEAEKCGEGKVYAPAGKKFSRQPNGTAILESRN
jgi:hypothetical protein